jgi:hypothetical protein
VNLRTINSVVELRKSCADLIAVADIFVFGSQGEADAALSLLPRRVRLLKVRVERVLTALEEGEA